MNKEPVERKKNVHHHIGTTTNSTNHNIHCHRINLVLYPIWSHTNSHTNHHYTMREPNRTT
jgi:hypothetical protein